MIVDVHTHYGVAWEKKYGTDSGPYIEVMDKNGVDISMIMGHMSFRRDTDMRKCNDNIKEAAERSDGRLVPYVTVHPDFGDEAVRELERCIVDLGMKGLKLHPWRQGMSLSSPVMNDIIEKCGELDVPLIFHDGTPSYSMSCQVGGLALRFPGTTFIMGHTGILELWRSAVSFAKRCPNVYVTLCSPYPAAIRYIIDNIEEDRIFWGSDFGPGFTDPIPYRKGLIDIIDMPDTTRAKIMGENAVRFFGLS